MRENCDFHGFSLHRESFSANYDLVDQQYKYTELLQRKFYRQQLFPLKTRIFSSTDVFLYTVYNHQPHMTYRCATFIVGMDSSFIIQSKCLPIQKDVSLSNSLVDHIFSSWFQRQQGVYKICDQFHNATKFTF